eukprot:3076194-Prymnesium_polylepis.1
MAVRGEHSRPRPLLQAALTLCAQEAVRRQPCMGKRRSRFVWGAVPASPAALGSSRAYVACWTAAAAPLR